MMGKLSRYLRSLFQKRVLEQELDEELRFHLEKEIEENIRRGMSAEEARTEALRNFGGVERFKEECRDQRGVRFLEELWHDLRFGVRRMLKSPAFSIIAILSLALGIGANTAIFSLVNTILLRPLPVSQPEQLVSVYPVTK